MRAAPRPAGPQPRDGLQRAYRIRAAPRPAGPQPRDGLQRGPRVEGRRERARVVARLDRVERQITDQPRDRGVTAADAAQRVERMRRDGEAALRVDLADGLERAETGRHALLEKEAQEVAVE